VPDHAAVDLSVRLAQADRHAARYAGLINAVLRRTAREGKAKLAGLDAAMLDTPDWLMRRWIVRYGETTARAIARARARTGARPDGQARRPKSGPRV
jgi:16S rRNA (cytosine967-C5)-methyltransferase